MNPPKKMVHQAFTNQSIIDPDLIGMKISPNPSFPKRGIVPPFGKGR
jgi:hypothetical protein